MDNPIQRDEKNDEELVTQLASWPLYKGERLVHYSSLRFTKNITPTGTRVKGHNCNLPPWCKKRWCTWIKVKSGPIEKPKNHTRFEGFMHCMVTSNCYFCLIQQIPREWMGSFAAAALNNSFHLLMEKYFGSPCFVSKDLFVYIYQEFNRLH